MNLFMMYEEANESASAGAKLGQDRLRFARAQSCGRGRGPTWSQLGLCVLTFNSK